MLFITPRCLVLTKSNATFSISILRNLSITFDKPGKIQRILSHKTSKKVNPLISNASTMLLDKKLNALRGIQENISSLQMKKRPLRKKKAISDEDETTMPGVCKFINYA